MAWIVILAVIIGIVSYYAYKGYKGHPVEEQKQKIDCKESAPKIFYSYLKDKTTEHLLRIKKWTITEAGWQVRNEILKGRGIDPDIERCPFCQETLEQETGLCKKCGKKSEGIQLQVNGLFFLKELHKNLKRAQSNKESEKGSSFATIIAILSGFLGWAIAASFTKSEQVTIVAFIGSFVGCRIYLLSFFKKLNTNKLLRAKTALKKAAQLMSHKMPFLSEMIGGEDVFLEADKVGKAFMELKNRASVDQNTLIVFARELTDQTDLPHGNGDINILNLAKSGCFGLIYTAIFFGIIYTVVGKSWNLSAFKLAMAAAIIGWPAGVGCKGKKLEEQGTFKDGAVKCALFSAISGAVIYPILIKSASIVFPGELVFPGESFAPVITLSWRGALMWGVMTLLSIGISSNFASNNKKQLKKEQQEGSVVVPAPAAEVEQVATCPNCRAIYHPSDYNSTAAVWNCPTCKHQLPRS